MTEEIADENLCKECHRQINPTDEDSYFHSAKQREICHDIILEKLYKKSIGASA